MVSMSSRSLYPLRLRYQPRRCRPFRCPPPAAPPPAPAAKPVNLSKITLEKCGQSVSLEKKHAKGFGEVLFNLYWNRRPKGGLFSGLRGGKRIDLDLGCLWELEDGRIGVVQALGNAWGDFRN